jgi:peptidyl-prolyl cis-trans isomerase D
MAHDVFISYSSHDKATADAVCHALEARGIRCWIAPRDVQVGDMWKRSIVEAIREAPIMVLIFSGEANRSPQVQREVDIAFEAGRAILPFRIEAVEVSTELYFCLAARHWLDALTPPLEHHIEKLLTAVRALQPTVNLDPASSPGAHTVSDAPQRPAYESRMPDVPQKSAARSDIPGRSPFIQPSTRPVASAPAPRESPRGETTSARRRVLYVGTTVVLVVSIGIWMNGRTDIVARAESQELSVERLAQLIGTTDMPLTQELANGVAGMWVTCQLLALAAARGDSLRDTMLLDEALWRVIAEARVTKWKAQLMTNVPKYDPSSNAARYAQGEVLAARHIMFKASDGVTPAGRDSARRRAESLRDNLTSGNFAAMASRYTEDPGGKRNGGNLGVFMRGTMVPEFEKQVLALKPGEVSGVVQTQFGYHIIRRSTYAEVGNDLALAMTARNQAVADSIRIARLEERSNVRLRNNAPALVRQVARNLEESRDDNTTIATTSGGDFTAAKLARWIASYPEHGRYRQILQTAPDSIVLQFVEQMVQNELLLLEATNANVGVDPTELARSREKLGRRIIESWSQLGVAPEQLAYSGLPEADREQVAAARIERYLDGLLANKTQLVPLEPELERLVRERYEWKLSTAGVERALERAQKMRSADDSRTTASRR